MAGNNHPHPSLPPSRGKEPQASVQTHYVPIIDAQIIYHSVFFSVKPVRRGIGGNGEMGVSVLGDVCHYLIYLFCFSALSQYNF
jgi:hypothetical protein